MGTRSQGLVGSASAAPGPTLRSCCLIMAFVMFCSASDPGTLLHPKLSALGQRPVGAFGHRPMAARLPTHLRRGPSRTHAQHRKLPCLPAVPPSQLLSSPNCHRPWTGPTTERTSTSVSTPTPIVFGCKTRAATLARRPASTRLHLRGSGVLSRGEAD